MSPIVVRHDGISLAVRDTVRAIASDSRFSVRYFGCVCELEGIVHRPCMDVSDLLLDPYYNASDVTIFHFGFHHSLFDALLAGGPPTRIVCFHNVTPARFVRANDVPGIKRSLRQIDLLRRADEIWAVSPTNARELLDRGFEPTRVRVIPLVVEDPAPAALVEKTARPAHILYVGRLVPSKGLHDLIEAVAQARFPPGHVRVTIAGNTAWTDPLYLTHLHELVVQYRLSEAVHIVGKIDDGERERLLHSAHILAIPSYHEGFCRPVAEGLRAGCIPLVYDAYNLPHIAGRLGRVVPTGDVGAFGAAMADLVDALPAALQHTAETLLPLDRGATSAAEFTEAARRHLEGFAFETVAAQIRQRLLQCLQRTG